MRITTQMMNTSMQANLGSAIDRLMTLQNQASSGKRIQSVSDDPIGAAQAMGYRSSLASIAQYSKNVTQAKLQLGLADSTLSDVTKALQEAKRVGLQGANAATSDDQRKAMAVQVQQQIDNILQDVNATNLDHHLYGGFATTSDPVSLNPAGGSPPYVYNGDDGVTKVAMNDSTEIQTSLTAKQILNFGGAADASSPDLMTTLVGLRDALNANDTTAIQTGLKNLEGGIQSTITLRGLVGARAQQVELHATRLSDAEATISEQLTSVEDVDITKVLTQLQTEQNVYQASLLATSKMVQSSLADYLK
ncbi:MAG TPA: flagellar hook-associated protein FlgL [Armatimonadota bacterium]|jgi:flagellar hook-associated protein 3 FlgL